MSTGGGRQGSAAFECAGFSNVLGREKRKSKGGILPQKLNYLTLIEELRTWGTSRLDKLQHWFDSLGQDAEGEYQTP